MYEVRFKITPTTTSTTIEHVADELTEPMLLFMSALEQRKVKVKSVEIRRSHVS